MQSPESEQQDTTLHAPQGQVELQRKPKNEFLRAWDAADEFLLKHLAEQKNIKDGSSILILNDSFGALATALKANKSEHKIFSWNDSLLAQQALRQNLLRNDIEADALSSNVDMSMPTGDFDIVLIKIPKLLALLEYQLVALRAQLSENPGKPVIILGAGMSRNIHSSTLQLFESNIGVTTSSRAVKKSRIIEAQFDPKLKPSANQSSTNFPSYYELQVERDGREYRIGNHANLFSRDKLDQGSRFMIENMPVSSRFENICDLGCGNGVLGIIAASFNPHAQILFCDESHMAIASAEENFADAFDGKRTAEFNLIDALDGVKSKSQDLILINPPFHQEHSIGDAIAWKMFKDSNRVLAPDGEIWVVGNRQLGYFAKLKKLFGNCTAIAGNKKFGILKAIKKA